MRKIMVLFADNKKKGGEMGSIAPSYAGKNTRKKSELYKGIPEINRPLGNNHLPDLGGDLCTGAVDFYALYLALEYFSLGARCGFNFN